LPKNSLSVNPLVYPVQINTNMVPGPKHNDYHTYQYFSNNILLILNKYLLKEFF